MIGQEERKSVRKVICRALKATLDDERETIAKNNDVVASVNEPLLKLELQKMVIWPKERTIRGYLTRYTMSNIYRH